MTNILGVNAYHGDSAACIVQDGKLIAAAAEERFNRQKHWAGFPAEAIRFCLEASGLTGADLHHVAFSRDPSAHLHDRVLGAAMSHFPRMMTVKDRLAHVGRKRAEDQALADALRMDRSQITAQFHAVEHHRAHLASAFFVSPFEEAALLSVDGFGDFVSTMSGHGRGNQFDVLDWIEYPHSLGMLYTATTQYLGFKDYGDEGKVMGLAPYGQPRYLEEFRKIVRLLPEGRFELNLDFFTHHSYGVEMLWDSGTPELVDIWSSAFADAFGPARRRGGPLEERHQDIAASLQTVLEEALLHLCLDLHRRVPVPNLCLAGGVALNCTFNGMIRKKTPFREVYIQPAAGDDGTAIGAAYYVHHQLNRSPRSFVMRHAYTGSSFTDAEIEAVLNRRQVAYDRCVSPEELAAKTAQLLAGGNVVGWFQGAMEFGPRALGNRSILADPRRPEMKETLNERIKYRESFRPFAPSILLERTGDYFEQDYPSPFMLMAYKTRPEKAAELPTVIHQDGTGRVQTVDREVNPRYWTLIKSFEQLTGTPVLVNTSFNENEPIVRTVDDALDCFFKTKMDAVAVGSFLVVK